MSIHAHKLPTIARSKLLELESAADEAQGLVAKTTLRIKELEVAIGTAGADSDTSVANLEHELSRLRAVQSKQQSLHSHRAQLAARLGQWLYTLSPNVQLVDVKARRPVLAKGETHLQAVTRIRSDIEKLKNELRLVQQAGPPIADVKRQARDYVRTLAERGRPTIKVGYETGFELVMPTSSYSSTPLLSAVLAWLDPDTLINKINAEIAEYKNQLRSVVESTSFAGENWLLNGDPAAPPEWSVIGSFVRGPNGEYQPQTIDFPSSQTIMIDLNNPNGGLLTKSIDANPTGTARNRCHARLSKLGGASSPNAASASGKPASSSAARNSSRVHR